jgi:hypothetical protein
MIILVLWLVYHHVHIILEYRRGSLTIYPVSIRGFQYWQIQQLAWMHSFPQVMLSPQAIAYIPVRSERSAGSASVASQRARLAAGCLPDESVLAYHPVEQIS